MLLRRPKNRWKCRLSASKSSFFDPYFHSNGLTLTSLVCRVDPLFIRRRLTLTLGKLNYKTFKRLEVRACEETPSDGCERLLEQAKAIYLRLFFIRQLVCLTRRLRSTALRNRVVFLRGSLEPGFSA